MKKYNSLTDEMLALRYVEGDDKAFDELLARNQQKLYNYILYPTKYLITDMLLLPQDQQL